MSNTPAIVCRNISKTYSRGLLSVPVLKGVDMTVARGEVLAIQGPSGAGKSTLLNIIGTLDHITGGELTILDRELKGASPDMLGDFRNRSMGFIFQLHNLLQEFTALENVMMPLRIRRMPMGKAKKDAMAMLDHFGLAHRAQHRPGEMSGGECQRVAVARAIVGTPPLLLADEPTGSLDSENSRMLMDSLIGLGKEQGTTILIVTHDKDVASRADRVISLHDGKVAPEILTTME